MTRRTVGIRKIAGLLLGFALLYGMGTALPLRALVGESPKAAEPLALVEPATYDFGAVKKQVVLKARFAINNLGRQRLILRRDAAGCNCTTSDTEILIPPDGRRELTVEFGSGDAAGRRALEVVYRSNDPRQPLIRLNGNAVVED